MLCSESRFGVDRCVCCAVKVDLVLTGVCVCDAVRVDLVLICVCVVQ